MYVCICSAVTDAEVRSCIAAGARSVEDVGEGCGAGTGCGSCHDHIEVLIAAANAPLDDRVPAGHRMTSSSPWVRCA